MRPPRYQRQMRRPPRQKQRQPELKLRRHPPHGPRCHPRPHPPATVVTSDGATGVEPIGENACASCDASAIISPTPAAATKTVFLMGYDLSLPVAARRQKSAFCRETQSNAPPQGYRVHIGSIGFGLAPRPRIWKAHPDEILSTGVCNFEQTVAARSGKFRPTAG
jgi:hypothetical protein